MYIIYFKENTQLTEQNNSVLTSPNNEINNMGYMDSSGTTYFSPPTYIADTLNDINLYLSNSIKNNRITNFEANEKFFKWENNAVPNDEFSDVMVKLN